MQKSWESGHSRNYAVTARELLGPLTLFTGRGFFQNTIEVLLHLRPDLVTFAAMKFLKNVLLSKHEGKRPDEPARDFVVYL